MLHAIIMYRALHVPDARDYWYCSTYTGSESGSIIKKYVIVHVVGSLGKKVKRVLHVLASSS